MEIGKMGKREKGKKGKREKGKNKKGKKGKRERGKKGKRVKAGLHRQYFLAILLSNAISRPAYCRERQYPGIEKFLLKLHC